MEKLKSKFCGISVGLVLSAAVSFMLCVYAPLELFLAGQDEFWFSIKALVPVTVVLFISAFLLLAVMFAVLKLIGNTVYNIGVLVIAAVFFICYIQGNFLVSGIPSLDGVNIDWNAPSVERIKSVAVCLVVIGVLLFVLLKFKEVIFRKSVLYGTIALSVMLVITLSTFALTTPIVEKDGDLVPTGKNDFVFSSDKNLIVFVVDAVESKRFKESLDKNSEFKDTFDDFTYYDDAAAMYPFTLNAISSMLTGQWNENESTHREYVRDSFKESPLFNYLREENYKTGLYNDREIILPSEYDGWFENQVNTESRFSSPVAAAVTAIKMSAIRYAPWDLKRLGYNLTTHLQHAKYIAEDPVKADNLSFYAAIKDSNPIKVVEEKCARIIHIEGAHVPFLYDKDVNIKEDATYMDNVECTLTICDKFIGRLKESGVYDNSAVIILADHGFDDSEELDVTARANPLLLVKGIGEKGEEMKTDSTPVSFEDISEAFTKLLSGETSEQVFKGYSYPNGRRFLRYNFTKENHMEEYIIHGRADDLENILPSGNIYDYKD